MLNVGRKRDAREPGRMSEEEILEAFRRLGIETEEEREQMRYFRRLAELVCQRPYMTIVTGHFGSTTPL
jgi:hypothetical protein